MRMLLSGIVALGLAGGLLVGAPSPSQANLVANGSFEEPVIPCGPCFATNDATSWTHSGAAGDGPRWRVGYVDGGGSITVAGEGAQFVTMGGGGTVGTASWSQTISGITPGQYDLFFKQASETPSDTQTIVVDFPVGSSDTDSFVSGPSSANYWRNWQQNHMVVDVTGTTLTLRFTSTTLHDVGLDDVVLTAVSQVPEPGSLLLVGVGLVTIGAVVRRRHRLS